jgi:RNA polymerase sigma-70 factor (ECF subfamily)
VPLIRGGREPQNPRSLASSNGLEPVPRSGFVTPLTLVRQKEEHPHESQAVVDGALVMVVSEHASGRLGADCSDTELVEAALRDPSSFLALYERYFPKVQRYVRIRVADRAGCEDIASEVFMAALAGLPRFRGSGSFAAWLFRIAQNAVRSHHRSDRTVQLDETTFAAIPGEERGPPEEALRRERVLQLRALVSGLKPEQQNLLALRYGAELESHEIGEVLGKSAVAVRVALHRTVAELRRRYPDEER